MFIVAKSIHFINNHPIIITHGADSRRRNANFETAKRLDNSFSSMQKDDDRVAFSLLKNESERTV